MKESFSTSKSTKYILVDFSCSREYTHHAEYLFAFANHLRGMGLSYELWINRAADSGVRSLLRSHSVFPILNSLDYSFDRTENFPIFILNKITNGILGKIRISVMPFRFRERILDIVSSALTRPAIRRMKQLICKNERLVIICPSTDGLTLRFLRSLAVHNLNQITVSMRIIGAESRGILGTSELVPSINRIADQISDLRVGWEVDSMKSRMIEFGVDPERLYWAPIPSSFKPVPKPNSPKRITLGFLGSARRNKGFSSIPNIAYSLNHSEIKLFVQQANFAWDGYSETLQELLGQGDRISFLPGAASNEELRLALSECSVLVLPYLADSYRFAGSGIMYQAANLGIPIICTEGVGFDWDVKNFGIGSTFRTLEDLHELIINFDSSSYFQNIIEYNRARNLACTEFLR